jgi:hypothetical protein
MKTKGQLPVCKLEPLAVSLIADVGKRSNPAPSKGAHRGFESHRRLHSKAPANVEALTRAVSNTAFAVSDAQTHYLANGCGTQGEFHDDLPQLPDRMPKIR